jgi:alpha-L-fucosidase
MTNIATERVRLNGTPFFLHLMKYVFFPTAVFLFAGCTATVPPPEPLLPVPTERQLAWHEMEQIAFIHFTVNTFTDREWGYGDESPSIFHPTAFDAEQWVTTLKDAGMKEIILTCKHHDGFCLWPSKYTEHSVKNSPFMNGQGDVVRALSEACHRHGVKMGVYLSPWDRHQASYGTPEYITFYRNQLRELLTLYGDIREVWFDGANGGDGYYGGARERRNIDNSTYYDWDNTWAIVRELAPQAVMFSDAGPDVRWCGNESGYVGDPNWCTINLDTLYAGKPNTIDLLNHGEPHGKSWVPAEVDVSIRPGWFYHAAQDDMVRTPENLFRIYLQSVGRGSVLLLNVPPDRRGLLHENDVKALQEWKQLIDAAFSVNLAAGAKATADSHRGKSKAYAAARLTDGDRETYWTTDDHITQGTLEIELQQPQTVRYVLMQEYIRLGQRITDFTVEIWKDNAWTEAGKGTTIGYKRILPIEPPAVTDKLRIRVNAKACPVISTVEVY